MTLVQLPQDRFARPANQLTDNSFENVNTPRYDENVNSVDTIGGNENGTEISNRYDRTGSEGILRPDSQNRLLGSGVSADGVIGGKYLPSDRVSVSDNVKTCPAVFDEADEKVLNASKIPHNAYSNTIVTNVTLVQR